MILVVQFLVLILESVIRARFDTRSGWKSSHRPGLLSCFYSDERNGLGPKTKKPLSGVFCLILRLFFSLLGCIWAFEPLFGVFFRSFFVSSFARHSEVDVCVGSFRPVYRIY